jgi:hypothetical protein
MIALTTMHRDAVVAIAAANDPCVPDFCLTPAQRTLKQLAMRLFAESVRATWLKGMYELR